MLYTCYFCQKKMPKEETKRCSRCLLVTYCSKECQKVSWKSSHKHNCTIHPSLISSSDPSKPLSKSDLAKDSPEYVAIQIDRDLSRWLQFWRGIFCSWTLLALDLANHPRDRVMTHCLLLYVQERRHREPFKRYEVVDVSVVEFASIVKDNPDLEANIDPRDFTRLRYVVILQEEDGAHLRLRLLQWNHRNLERFRTRDKTESAALGESRPEFARNVIDTVYTMDPEEATKKVAQGYESWF